MRGKITRITNTVAVFALVVSIISPLAYTQDALAADEGISNITNKAATIGDPVAITDLQVTGTGNDNVTMTVHAEDGEFSLDDTDVTASGIGTNSLTVKGNRGDVNASLSTLMYIPHSIGTVNVTVSLGSNVTGNVIIDPGTGRAYTIVQANLTWNQARVAAKNLEYGGVQGYLANITSDDEDAFIRAHLSGNGWIGASDQGAEGDWKWMDGPEAGTSFWSGAGAVNGGQPVLGPGDVPMYSNWNHIEPNNSNNEDCAEYIINQGWNDLNCDGQTRNYVVEFGAAEGVPDPVEKTFIVTATAATRNIATCEQLLALTGANNQDTISLTADIDCAGHEVVPLFEGDTFYGVFEGNSHTIRNVTIDMSGDYNVGLLSSAEDATIQNLRLSNFTVTAEDTVGALAGWVENTMITNVHVTNLNLQAEYGYAGGLVGEVHVYDEDAEGSIVNSSVSGGLITAADSNVGGLIGKANVDQGKLLIQKTYTDIDIESTSDSSGADTGGLVGELEIDTWDDTTAEIELHDVYAWGDVNVPEGENIGGLIGRVGVEAWGEDATGHLTITNAYARGNVTGSNEAGGLIGQLSTTDGGDGDAGYTITNTFAMGKVQIVGDNDEGDTYSGGLVGRNETLAGERTFTGNYYDRTRTTQTACATDDEDGEVLSCTAVNAAGNQPNYFINNASNAPMNTWDFEGVWVKNASVPPTFAPYTAPDETDGNGDGIPDSQQANVASFISPVNDKRVVVQLSDTCSITHASAAVESDVAKDAGYTYAGGLVSFDADCTSDNTEVVLYQYGVSAEAIVARKFNPDSGVYFTIDGATISTVTINGQKAVKAVYTIIDDGVLDLNKTPGKISDPVGLGVLAVGVPNTGLGGGKW